jgi:toxin-antitoxin system PIN domain toxin
MKAALLDTNVLLALAWPNHQHHAQAHVWFAAEAKKGWATCAFTQLGFIRLSSNPAYATGAVTPQDAAALLRQWTRIKTHRFWSSPAADDPALYARAIGHQQVNDAWLVEVARRNSGRLVTLDTRLPVHALEDGLVDVIKT